MYLFMLMRMTCATVPKRASPRMQGSQPGSIKNPYSRCFHVIKKSFTFGNIVAP